MTDKHSNDSRRKLLKSIAAGSGAVVAGKSLPESWSKPVVDAVILPAHAATTDDTGTDPTPTLAPTTTPGCCLVAGLYCAPIDGFIGYLEIEVTTAGDITVYVNVDDTQTLTAKVPCTGGTFTASDSDHTVTGTVGCNATSISGNASIFSSSAIGYNATPGDCEQTQD